VSRPWLAKAVFALDARLRRHHRVLEYSTHPLCVFRLDIVRASRAFVLRDGTRLRPGQRIARLHFWNEQMPPLPQKGATIGWARRMQQRIALSLHELADYLSSRPELSDISVVSGDIACGSRAHSEQFARIMARYGFETIAEHEHLSIGEHAHQFGENILISLIVFAQNARAHRRDSLKRDRVPICISCRSLAQRFSTAGERTFPAGKKPRTLPA
jgi:hypothetical protein